MGCQHSASCWLELQLPESCGEALPAERKARAGFKPWHCREPLNWDINTIPQHPSAPVSPEYLQAHYRNGFELFKAGLNLSEYRCNHFSAKGLNQPSFLLPRHWSWARIGGEHGYGLFTWPPSQIGQGLQAPANPFPNRSLVPARSLTATIPHTEGGQFWISHLSH